MLLISGFVSLCSDKTHKLFSSAASRKNFLVQCIVRAGFCPSSPLLRHSSHETYSFLCSHGWDHISSLCIVFLYKAALVVVNCLSVSFSWNIFICLPVFKDSLARYSTLGCQVFTCRAWNESFRAALAFGWPMRDLMLLWYFCLCT